MPSTSKASIGAMCLKEKQRQECAPVCIQPLRHLSEEGMKNLMEIEPQNSNSESESSDAPNSKSTKGRSTVRNKKVAKQFDFG